MFLTEGGLFIVVLIVPYCCKAVVYSCNLPDLRRSLPSVTISNCMPLNVISHSIYPFVGINVEEAGCFTLACEWSKNNYGSCAAAQQALMRELTAVSCVLVLGIKNCMCIKG